MGWWYIAYCRPVTFSFTCLGGGSTTFRCYKIVLGIIVNFRSPNVVFLIRDSFTFRTFKLRRCGFGFGFIEFHFGCFSNFSVCGLHPHEFLSTTTLHLTFCGCVMSLVDSEKAFDSIYHVWLSCNDWNLFFFFFFLSLIYQHISMSIGPTSGPWESLVFKGNLTIADLRCGVKSSISPSTLIFAPIKG